MSRKLNANEYKRKLEHQIYLAQEHPARIYDLTDCDLSQIPKGVFTFCKVLRKYSLNLSLNHISTLECDGNLDDLHLLGELILTKNKFKHLPSSFTKLCNLQKLIMDDNKLIKFPMVLVELKHLKILNLEGNSIRTIPKEVGGFKSLKSLNLSRNPINIIFSEICDIETLEELYIDLYDIKNISKDILSSGIDNVWKHLCKVRNKPFKAINLNGTCFIGEFDGFKREMGSEKEKLPYSYFSSSHQNSPRNQEIDNEVLEHEHKLSILELEDKRKNIDLIKKKSEMEDDAIKAILTKKKQETDRLFRRVKYEELSSKELIESIFDYNTKSMKREELENSIASRSSYNIHSEDYNIKLTDVQKNNLLDSMNTTLKRASESFRRRRVSGNLSSSNEDNFDGSCTFNLGYVDQLKETEREKLAFKRLKFEKDPQMKRLQESICLIELKLQQLSTEEMINPQSIDSDTNSRHSLLSLLTKLSDERKQRECDLNNQIESLDSGRDKSQKDFWIIQYQKLLDEKTKSDYEIEELLKLANFSQWTPIFQQYDYNFEMMLNLSEKDLAKMSLGTESERTKFLHFLKDWKFNPIKSSSASVPSAPSEQYRFLEEKSSTLAVPSAPDLQRSLSNQSNSNDESTVVLARKETECCICLNLEARILLLNCGHVCCCKQCSLTVKQCPLCRQKIVQRVNLEFDV